MSESVGNQKLVAFLIANDENPRVIIQGEMEKVAIRWFLIFIFLVLFFNIFNLLARSSNLDNIRIKRFIDGRRDRHRVVSSLTGESNLSGVWDTDALRGLGVKVFGSSSFSGVLDADALRDFGINAFGHSL